MTRLAQPALYCMAAILPGLLHQPARAQVAESVVQPGPGFHLPTLGGSLTYALSASESVSSGIYQQGGPAVSSNVSGDAAYISESPTHPFSVIYSGAVLAANANQPTTVAQNLGLSQVLSTRQFRFTLTDQVNYLPLSPTTGLSGIAGLGDMGTNPPVTGPVTGQNPLTGYSPRVNNSTTLGVVGRLTGKTSLTGSGSFVMQRFTGDAGQSAGLVDSNNAVGSLGASHTLDARSSLGASYTRSKITYSPDTSASAFNVEGLNFNYSRQLTRSFGLDASVGPQWVKTSASGGNSSLNLATDIVAHYTNRATTAVATYVRGTNSGFGVTPGGFSDSIDSSASRRFFHVWNGAVTVNYTRTANPAGLGLPGFSLDTFVAGVQASRGINRTLSTFASYNAQHQSAGGVASTSGAFRGLYQVFAFGVTYSPRTVSLGESQ